MKRGGLAFAVILAVSGILRVAGPGAASDTPRAVQATKGSERAQSKRSAYQDDLLRAIQEFYGTPDRSADTAELNAHWNVPADARALVQFVIAVLPDPVHTHLGLVFDRGLEALQQAALRKGYVFDRWILPWDATPHQQVDDLEERQQAALEQRERERYPGLLIFRQGADLREASRKQNPLSPGEPLFVLVVGETPTGGIRKTQFQNALTMMANIRGDQSASAKQNTDPLLILGPSFTGSMDSLQDELRNSGLSGPPGSVYVYSGTVTGVNAESQFYDPKNNFRFVSFQENDDYAREQFIEFACGQGYQHGEIAILTEDETAFGASTAPQKSPVVHKTSSPKDGASKQPGTHTNKFPESACEESPNEPAPDLVRLHFPREISYFRSAYLKAAAAQTQTAGSVPAPALPLDLSESGLGDDSVPPFAPAQTPASQEAVMIGVVTELLKHHIKFTLLYATDPVDQLFLASYLRTAYPQGRVVATVPDLLLGKEDATLLRGVLGLNAYSLLPGLDYDLCQQEPEGTPPAHEDRLFASSLNVGTYNAMIGLISLPAFLENPPPDAKKEDLASVREGHEVPPGPYMHYGVPIPSNVKGEDRCSRKPLLWLTILGRDGFWPIAALTGNRSDNVKAQEPIALVHENDAVRTLKSAPPGFAWKPPSNRIPPSWGVGYCICALICGIQIVLIWTGSVLADSEAQVQFGKTQDFRADWVMALGAVALACAFILVMCMRNPLVALNASSWLVVLGWLPFVVFVAFTWWELHQFRKRRAAALTFLLAVCVIVCFQLLLVWNPYSGMRLYWSTRILHFISGVSPVLPVLLLLAAAYWWMWMSLRGVCLVDSHRPRLPAAESLPSYVYHISDTEAERVRRATHPFIFPWRALLPVLLVTLIAAFLLGVFHAVETIDGSAYALGYTWLLAVIVAALLACLVKVVWTWSECRDVLSGLDRLPLREAFSRMKRLSWHSFWNPGGSTLRETYKVMSRGLENLDRLHRQIKDKKTPLADLARHQIVQQMCKIVKARKKVRSGFHKLLAASQPPSPAVGNTSKPSIKAVLFKLKDLYRARQTRADTLKVFMPEFENLQKEMANLTGVLLSHALGSWWAAETSPAVSEDDERFEKTKLSPARALAEEYAALVYVNFLVTVLLRIRTLVICAVGMYVFVVLALNVYPFEPHPALQTMAIVLLVLLGVAVGGVYAQMHRDPILSRLTSTSPGELGWDFWLKLISAGAIPVFSLLAVQFPQINQFLFSWLEPALQAVK